MPYFPVLNDVLEVTVGTYRPDQWGLNIMHWKVTNVVGAGASDLAIAAALDATFAPNYKTFSAADVQYWGTRVKKVFPLPATVPQRSVLAAGACLSGPVSLPAQVSGIISGKTAKTGRSQRTRIYLPFPSALFNDPATDRPLAAYLAAQAALVIFLSGADTITVGVNSTTIEWVVFHRATGLTDAVTTVQSNQKWATQRRRGNYGRPNVPPPF